MIRFAIGYFDSRALPTTKEWFNAVRNSQYAYGRVYRNDGVYPEYDFDYNTSSVRIDFSFKNKPQHYLLEYCLTTGEEKLVPQIKNYNSRIILRTKSLTSFYCAVAALGHLAKLCDGNVHIPEAGTYFKGKAAIDWARMQIWHK